VALVLAAVLPAAAARAQREPPAAGAPGRRVAGRVVRPGPTEMLPVRGAWVTLHRVAAVGAGPVDSARTGADGRYAFSYHAAPDDDALFIVSATYSGITYFGAPLREADVSGEPAEVSVFDTSSGPLRLTVRGRHVVMTGAAGDRLTVVEVYEVANDSSVTLTGGAAAAATWSAPLPPAAEGFRVGQGDISAAAAAAEGGRVRVYAPFAPGLKQLSFSYELPRAAFPLALSVDAATDVLEVLVEPQGARAEGATLAEVDPASVEGRTFRRFLAQDAPAGATVRVTLGAAAPGRPSRYAPWGAALAAGLLLAALAAALARRSAPAAPRPPDVSPAAEALARRIAELDDAGEGDARAAERARLKEELRAELAGGGGAR